MTWNRADTSPAEPLAVRRRVGLTLIGICATLVVSAGSCVGQTARSEPSHASSSQAQPSEFGSGDRAAFARFASEIPGPVGLAVLPVGTPEVSTLGDGAAAHGWSTTKVPVLVALLRAIQPTGLSATQADEATLAITQSDNQAILALFGDLEALKGGLLGASRYVQSLLRASGDRVTDVATAPPPPGAVTTFGQTEWSPAESVRFYAALAGGCLLRPSPTRYVLGLMERVEPSESWGLGQAGLPVPVAFKGGWGPESDGAYLVRQSGIIDPGTPDALAVSIVAHPPAGADSFEVGVGMVTDTAQWLAHHLRLTPHVDQGCIADDVSRGASGIMPAR